MSELLSKSLGMIMSNSSWGEAAICLFWQLMLESVEAMVYLFTVSSQLCVKLSVVP